MIKMKRSVINHVILDAIEFFHANQFHLPPFAYWSPQAWTQRGAEVEEIVKNALGWDVSDYGLDDYQRYGILLFTLRNGNAADWSAKRGKPYAEKLMIAQVDQTHQMHCHLNKVEDIINRNGGRLRIQFYNATADLQLADTPVTLNLDGVWRTLAAGDVITLNPGESVTIPTRCYHKFWAEDARVMMGEVSLMSDDQNDNPIYQPLGTGRFAPIEEDEPPGYLLSSDYKNYWQMN
jgi:D-lyxose ketol-isomerase